MNSSADSCFKLTTKPIENIRLLLVDDDDIDRSNIMRLLSDSDQVYYTITIAKEYQQALDLLNQKIFDICLIDYYLGGYTGLELLKKVQRINPESSVIMLTGQDDQHIDNQSLQVGFSDFLSKEDITATLLERSIRYAIHYKKMSLEHEYLAHYDTLTQLVNRSLFFDRLTHLTNQSHRHSRQHAILYIDLDFFKKVNDDYGHTVGDAVLQLFASRLLDSIRTVDTAARLGGDEFAVILEEIEPENAHIVSKKIIQKMEEPFLIDSLSLTVSVSIGMTFFPSQDALDPNRILKQADQALYHAKKSGRKHYRHFDSVLKKLAEENIAIENDLHLALRSKQIVPFYQAQYDLKTGEIIGFEALARWHHPKQGLILPGQFIPYAEKLALISTLTEEMLKRACADLSTWAETHPHLRMAINISASECANPHLLHVIKTLLHEKKIQAHQLELEVTESILIKHPQASIEVLNALHDLGVSISIDDFGTGYSSLSYLTELPIDTLKIDMSFVQGIGINPQKEIVVQVILDLAKRLSLYVVAEGVETQAQADFLLAHECDSIQGYLYSKPCSYQGCQQLLSKP